MVGQVHTILRHQMSHSHGSTQLFCHNVQLKMIDNTKETFHMFNFLIMSGIFSLGGV